MIHICLISEQLLANLIPVYVDTPNKVIMIVTKEMKERSEKFERIIKKQNIKVEGYSCDGFGYEAIWEQAYKIEEQISTSSEQIKLNVTGGTKLMAMAFSDVFESAERFYLDTANNRIEILGKKPTTKTIKSVLNIENYLEGQNAIFRSSDDEKTFQPRSVTQYLANHSKRLDGFIGLLNALCSNAIEKEGRTEKLRYPKQELKYSPNNIQNDALTKLKEAEIIWWDNNKSLEFESLEKTQYCKGGWLEEYVYYVIKDLAPDDVKKGVVLTWEGTAKKDAPKNEFDVVVVHHNKMLVIECKTSKFEKNEKGQEIVNKIENLGSHAGGTYGEALIVSARKIDEETKKRCDSNKVPYIDDLKELKNYISKWMN